MISGVAVVDSKFEISHQGLYLTFEGKVSMHPSEKNVGLFDAFTNSIKVAFNIKILIYANMY